MGLKFKGQAHTFIPSTQKAEAGGSLWVGGQPGLCQDIQERQRQATQWDLVSETPTKPSSISFVSCQIMSKAATFIFTYKVKNLWSVESINKINEIFQFAEEVWAPHSTAYDHQAKHLREDHIFYVKRFYKSSA